jgi:hypothetical protein
VGRRPLGRVRRRCVSRGPGAFFRPDVRPSARSASSPGRRWAGRGVSSWALVLLPLTPAGSTCRRHPGSWTASGTAATAALRDYVHGVRDGERAAGGRCRSRASADDPQATRGWEVLLRLLRCRGVRRPGRRAVPPSGTPAPRPRHPARRPRVRRRGESCWRGTRPAGCGRAGARLAVEL